MRRTGHAAGWRIVVVPVLRFAVLGAAALVVVGVALSLTSRRLGQREAIVTARSEAQVKGQAIVEPLLTDELLDDPPTGAAPAALDRAIRREVLDETLVRVKLWRTDGTILYADEPELVGMRYELDEDELWALADLVARLRAGGVETELDTIGLDPSVPDPAARLVYRTVQEALRNVERHAGAGHVRVAVRSAVGAVEAEVVDDGRGFTPGSAGAGHVGLSGLASLAADAGAHLDVTSTPGAGTTVRLVVPTGAAAGPP